MTGAEQATRPYPDLLSPTEQKELLTRAEQLWSDLQKNNLGGFSGINRPFYILNEFRRVIEAFGYRDTGLSWSKNDLDNHPGPAATESVRDALAWYGEQARLARLIHSEGDAGRHALAGDGGKRAAAALKGAEQ